MSNKKIEPIEHPEKLISYWKKDKVIVILIVVFGLTFNVSMILGPIYQGKLIDSIMEDNSLSSLIKLALIFVLFILIIQILRYLKRYYVRLFANHTGASMRFMIYNTILQKSAKELQNQNTGDLMTRAISDVELCVEGMRKFTTEVFDTGVLMVSYLITLLVYDFKTTLLSVIFIPVAMFLAKQLKQYVFLYTKSYRSKSSEVSSVTYDLIENVMLYRISGTDRENNKRYEESLGDLQKKAVKSYLMENALQPTYQIITMIGIIAVIMVGGDKVIDKTWTVGVFITYIGIFIAMAAKGSKASKLINSVHKSQVSWKRIQPYLSEYKNNGNNKEISKIYDNESNKTSKESKDSKDSKDSKETSKDTSIETSNETICDLKQETSLFVKQLSFQYNQDKKNAIENISFSAKQGDIIGITGPIACGKSTLGILMTGIYPYVGSITIDGRELSSYTETERSSMISYLGHQAELLSDTIKNNIAFDDSKSIEGVLRDVCFDTDLLSMPDGIDTLTGNDGIRLSGGQQMRIALARALYHKNKIIVLDDPFSAVDMKTEKLIMKHLKDNYKNSIIILISHRLSVFPELNKVLLLQDSKMLDFCTHEDLMQHSDLYATIFNLQRMESGDPHET